MNNNSTTFYDAGLYKNQHQHEPVQLPLSGKIPDWLSGNFVRNGPGMMVLPHQPLKHWFDGFAALHGFSIRNGKVDYSCRFLQCPSYETANRDGKLTYSEFATDPCKSIFKKVQSYIIPSPPNMTDNAKVNVAKIGERFMALGETPMMIEFDPETLETYGMQELIPDGFAYKTTAHPHFEADTAYNLVVKFGMFSFYRIHDVLHPKKPISSVFVKNPAYLHGFGMSKKYFIIAAGPLTAVPLELLFWKRPFIENHTWNPREGAKIYVIEKSTGKLKAKFETEAFFSFHHVNAWEEGEELVMDINAYDDASIIQKYYLKELENPDVELPFGTVRRYRMNLRSRKVNSEMRSSACIELPRIDYERYNTESNYRHVYGVSLHPDHRKGFYNSIVRINPETGENLYWYEHGCHPGEPYFIPSPGSKNDKDGIVLSIVLDTTKNRSFLLVLDAGSFEELARAEAPEPIIYGFHAGFFPS
ncbi:MAG: hypothetical protein RIQ47_1981 [Bacteroidota bacterium]|jgi:carotenoid cleavage dioxygenase-like enzyme